MSGKKGSCLVIYMQSVPGEPDMRKLSSPLPYFDINTGPNFVPAGFSWDGSSVPMRGMFGLFPRHRHPIASCRHDYRCSIARNDKERKFADEEFRKDVGSTSWWITKQAGYIGVRIGAFFGIGNNF